MGYAIQPPGVLRAEIEPATVHGPADLRAVVQQAVQLSPGYLGSTTRDMEVRLREHANALLAGTHSCLQAQEQPVIDQLWREHPGSSAADSEARAAAYMANLEQRCVVVARVSAASFGGDRSQMEVLLGAAEQVGIDACSATILNRSLTVGPRFVSMPGMCQATGERCGGRSRSCGWLASGVGVGGGEGGSGRPACAACCAPRTPLPTPTRAPSTAPSPGPPLLQAPSAWPGTGMTRTAGPSPRRTLVSAPAGPPLPVPQLRLAGQRGGGGRWERGQRQACMRSMLRSTHSPPNPHTCALDRPPPPSSTSAGALRMARDGYDEDGRSIAAQNIGEGPCRGRRCRCRSCGWLASGVGVWVGVWWWWFGGGGGLCVCVCVVVGVGVGGGGGWGWVGGGQRFCGRQLPLLARRSSHLSPCFCRQHPDGGDVRGRQHPHHDCHCARR